MLEALKLFEYLYISVVERSLDDLVGISGVVQDVTYSGTISLNIPGTPQTLSTSMYLT